ncbi:MAG TPA: hypothetical protein VK760_07690, partial [Candidatus Acidoferrales bacterium]|nr:hypothetical protein [Candidatus Acidoferrales bacterium]
GEGGVSDPPTGNVLSSNQSASFSVVAGQANGINVSLDGVAAGIVLVPAANSSFFGNMQAGYSISKCGTASPNGENVSVFATDADMNLIIGPGAPATTLASNDTTLIAVATPAPNAPNLYTISHPISKDAQNPATLTATATTADDAGGGTQTAHALVQTLGGTQLCGLITEFGLPGGASASPAGITTGPDGNLWFTESQIGRIGKITTDGTISTYTAPGGYPWNIVTGPDNNLWFSDFQNGIGTSTTAGVVTYASTGLSYQQRVQGIAPDPTTGVWVTEQSGASVDKWDGALTQYAVADPYYGPVGIAYGPDGNFWVALGSGQIERITTAGTPTVFSGPTGAPQSITVGSDNKLWFGERGIVNAIGRMTTAGTVTNEYALPFGSNPNAITLGPDSNVWFAEQGSNQIGKITTAGTITQYVLQSGASPQGITAGPDGNIWFTECGTGVIGRLQ